MYLTVGALAMALGLFATPVAAEVPSKPNIIFILADDIGLPGFGCTGGIFKTPNIDALAARAARERLKTEMDKLMATEPGTTVVPKKRKKLKKS